MKKLLTVLLAAVTLISCSHKEEEIPILRFNREYLHHLVDNLTHQQVGEAIIGFYSNGVIPDRANTYSTFEIKRIKDVPDSAYIYEHIAQPGDSLILIWHFMTVYTDTVTCYEVGLYGEGGNDIIRMPGDTSRFQCYARINQTVD